MSVLLVSDLHLDADHPATVDTFLRFLGHEARSAQALYILGDLFEHWIGDDDRDPVKARVCDALRDLTQAGTALFVMQGNRDFLLGAGFERRTGGTLLPDPVVATFESERVLLTHGDLLCTDDHSYQELRSTVREESFHRRVLALPLETREWLAGAARAGSKAHTRATAANIMDVNASAVIAAFEASGTRFMIHGHTHRPGEHRHATALGEARRVVLAAWENGGEYLEWTTGRTIRHRLSA